MSAATFLATRMLCGFGNALAQTSELHSAEADALEFMHLFAELKRDYFASGSETWGKPALTRRCSIICE